MRGTPALIFVIEDLHSQVSEVLRMMLSESDADVLISKHEDNKQG